MAAILVQEYYNSYRGLTYFRHSIEIEFGVQNWLHLFRNNHDNTAQLETLFSILMRHRGSSCSDMTL